MGFWVGVRGIPKKNTTQRRKGATNRLIDLLVRRDNRKETLGHEMFEIIGSLGFVAQMRLKVEIYCFGRVFALINPYIRSGNM